MSAPSPATSAARSAVVGMSPTFGASASVPSAKHTLISLDEVERLRLCAPGEGNLADHLLPVETALDDIPALAVSGADAARLRRGQAVLLRGRDAPPLSGTCYVTAEGALVALAEAERGEVHPKRVFHLPGR